MCGRFNSIASGKDFSTVFDAEFVVEELTPNHNVAPTTLVYVLTREHAGLQLGAMTWGLVPSWSKDNSRSASMINARSETLTEKPSFRNLLSQHRCVLPIDGFYEWKNLPSDTKKPKKQAFYISRADNKVMTVAGLWTSWKQPDSSVLRTCTIITTEANQKLFDVHHRMPVILEHESVMVWLQDSKTAPIEILVSAPDDVVTFEPTDRLNSASNTSSTQFDDDASGRLF